MKTSQSNPLFVDEIRVGPGRISLTICPGKKGDSIFGAPWDRDLSVDLVAILHWGAEAEGQSVVGI